MGIGVNGEGSRYHSWEGVLAAIFNQNRLLNIKLSTNLKKLNPMAIPVLHKCSMPTPIIVDSYKMNTQTSPFYLHAGRKVCGQQPTFELFQ